jgi:hypothetical protein
VSDAQTTIEVDGLTWAPWDDLRAAKARVAELEAEVARLKEAVWQALDDMDEGLSVRQAAKDQLIAAYAFDGEPDEWPSAVARAARAQEGK